jgi:succinyl-CoA synthetase alpha subunit
VGIIIDRQKKVIVQGITGREGSLRSKLMKEYGTRIVAGVTPGRKGQVVHGIPVFNSVQEVVENFGPIDISVIFVPAPLVKNAAFEAIASGIKLVVLIPDRVPIYDTLEIAEFCQTSGARYIGPNTLGLISPGEGLL